MYAKMDGPLDGPKINQTITAESGEAGEIGENDVC